jgi:putative transposase
MPQYIRAFAPGCTFFFTLVTYRRRPLFRSSTARRILREAIAETRRRRPFTIDAFVLLPDHLHTLWALPDGDGDFSTRWRKIKEAFTRGYLAVGGREARVTSGQAAKAQRGVWQQRFWEHTIRDEVDFERHVDYIHFNPVKHGLVECPHAWPWSTFRQWVAKGVYDWNWCCACNLRRPRLPNFARIPGGAGE